MGAGVPEQARREAKVHSHIFDNIFDLMSFSAFWNFGLLNSTF